MCLKHHSRITIPLGHENITLLLLQSPPHGPWVCPEGELMSRSLPIRPTEALSLPAAPTPAVTRASLSSSWGLCSHGTLCNHAAPQPLERGKDALRGVGGGGAILDETLTSSQLPCGDSGPSQPPLGGDSRGRHTLQEPEAVQGGHWGHPVPTPSSVPLKAAVCPPVCLTLTLT